MDHPVFSLIISLVNFINCSPNSSSCDITLPFSTTAGGQIYSPLPVVVVAANTVLTHPWNWSFLNGFIATLIAYPPNGYGSWISFWDIVVSTIPGCVALTRILGYSWARWRARYRAYRSLASLERPYCGLGPRSRLISSSEANFVSLGVPSCRFEDRLTIRAREDGEAVFLKRGRSCEVKITWPK